MEKVSKITKDIFGSKGIKKAAGAAFVCNMFKKSLQRFFEKDFLREIMIISFSKKSVIIKTPNNFYAQEIKLKEKDILKEANQRLENDSIESIRFR